VSLPLFPGLLPLHKNMSWLKFTPSTYLLDSETQEGRLPGLHYSLRNVCKSIHNDNKPSAAQRPLDNLSHKTIGYIDTKFI